MKEREKKLLRKLEEKIDDYYKKKCIRDVEFRFKQRPELEGIYKSVPYHFMLKRFHEKIKKMIGELISQKSKEARGEK